MSKRAVFFLLAIASSMFMTLQVALAVVLSVLAQTPYFAISFAFIGLSASGVYRYIRRSKMPEELSTEQLGRYFLAGGAALALATLTIKGLDLVQVRVIGDAVARAQSGELGEQWFTILMLTTTSASIIGFMFSLVFFSLGLTMTTIYDCYSRGAPRLYLFDLLGAAVGCVLGTYIYSLLDPGSVFLVGAVSCFTVASVLAWRSPSRRTLAISGATIALLMVLINVTWGGLEIRPNTNFLARDWSGKSTATEIWSGWNAYSRVGLLRVQPKGSAEPPHHIFSINQAAGHALARPYRPNEANDPLLDEGIQPSDLAFLLGTPRSALVLFAGAGRDMVEIDNYSRGKTEVTGVEINPLIVNRARRMKEFNLGRFYDLPHINMVVAEGRSYLESLDKKFDSIVLSYSGASAAEYLGTQGYTGQYLYTLEAFVAYLEHLEPDGTLVIVNLNKLKILGLIKAAFLKLGIDDISDKVILFDKASALKNGRAAHMLLYPWEQKRLVVKKSGFTKEDMVKVQRALKQTKHEFIYRKGYSFPPLDIFRSLIESKDSAEDTLDTFSHHLTHNLELATDDRPFIQRTFSLARLMTAELWGSTLGIGSAKGRGATPLGSEALRLIFNLVLFAVGFAFVLLPLMIKKRQHASVRGFGGVLLFFGGLGLAFMLIEIALIQRFSLLVGNPIYAFAVVLSSLLLSAGLGGAASSPLFGWGIVTLKRSVLFASLAAALAYLIVPVVVQHSLAFPAAVRFLLAVILLFPFGFTLGMAFPQALKSLGDQGSDMVPWAWAMNGYMSVVGSALASYLSVVFGFSGLMLLAALIYGALSFIRVAPSTRAA